MLKACEFVINSRLICGIRTPWRHLEVNMDLNTVTNFFMWCSLINAALLILWTLFFVFVPDFVYKTQSRVMPLKREQFDVAFYCLIGLFKIMFIFFNLVPYLALKIIA